MQKKIFLAFLFGSLFLVAGTLTNRDYGVSWDEPEHFLRGQSYLHLFLKGEKTYASLPKYDLERARLDPSYHDRSYYQHDSYDTYNWLISDAGHPPLNGIAASFVNFIFYQKLGLLGDIESYHLFNIIISAILVATVFIFSAEVAGVKAGIFSVIFLSSYPLFWSESHFNIKDPVQTAFFLLAIFLLWKWSETKKIRTFYLAAVFSGIALSVKFNILFLPFIIIPWVVILLFKNRDFSSLLFSKKIILPTLFFPIIMFSVLIASWPFLWQDILGNLTSTFIFYGGIGTEKGFSLNPSASWNLYPIKWIIFTTPPLIILFFVLGVFAGLRSPFKKNSAFVLWSSLFLVAVGRVSFPNTTIYGGVRQIMEYIPGVALIAGLGADYLTNITAEIVRVKRRSLRLVQGLSIIGVFTVLVMNLFKIHPNENVYFNSIVGGLQGAIDGNIPSWGNSYGNAYLQGIKWLNINAEKNSRLALIQGTSLNIPTVLLRSDIDFSNSYWSGIYREGEYLMDMTHDNYKFYPYAWEYVEKLLMPIYEVKADGVSILIIWKNDLKNTKNQYRRDEVILQSEPRITRGERKVIMDIGRDYDITRLLIVYQNVGCEIKDVFAYTSRDGITWASEKETIPTVQVADKDKIVNPHEFLFFPAKSARFLKLETNYDNSCIFKKPLFRLYVLKD